MSRWKRQLAELRPWDLLYDRKTQGLGSLDLCDLRQVPSVPGPVFLCNAGAKWEQGPHLGTEGSRVHMYMCLQRGQAPPQADALPVTLLLTFPQASCLRRHLSL